MGQVDFCPVAVMFVWVFRLARGEDRDAGRVARFETSRMSRSFLIPRVGRADNLSLASFPILNGLWESSRIGVNSRDTSEFSSVNVS